MLIDALQELKVHHPQVADYYPDTSYCPNKQCNGQSWPCDWVRLLNALIEDTETRTDEVLE